MFISEFCQTYSVFTLSRRLWSRDQSGEQAFQKTSYRKVFPVRSEAAYCAPETCIPCERSPRVFHHFVNPVIYIAGGENAHFISQQVFLPIRRKYHIKLLGWQADTLMWNLYQQTQPFVSTVRSL